jgi:hypothetical protein
MTEQSELHTLEAALEHEREVSRDAARQLAQIRDPEPMAARGVPVPITNVSSWTVDAAMQHFTALREADHNFYNERDRCYAEVAVEREKALKIKETADLAALELARQIQEYKDEKANELRSQIEREQGERATKSELQAAVEKVETQIKPLSSEGDQRRGVIDLQSRQVALLGAVATVIYLVVHYHP